MSYYIHAKKFFLKNTTENGGYLEVTDDGKFGKFYTTDDEKPEGKIVDYSDKFIAPGLVDTHIHGLVGHDVMDDDFDKLNEMSEGLLKAGVTSWLPTTLTASHDQLKHICQTIGDNYKKATGAKIQGIHFEGPFYTEKHKGAQNPKYFRDPDAEEFEDWQDAAHGMIKKISIAPERKGAPEFVKAVASDDVAVYLGHSDATFEQAKACVEAGATGFTHTYNGMSGLNHRLPGMVGAALSMHLVDDELICDGHHVNPFAARIVIEKKGAEHVALITDCMRAGLMPDGDYVLGELPVVVADGTARLKDETHNLAGSILMLNEAIKNVVDWNIATDEEAVEMASYTAAKSSKVLDKCGIIADGRDADFIVLDDDMTLSETYLDGVSRYQA
ncbi:N-acetylglucosamine-6-phosphate deacetylase [Companilactobacillus crustorum]|uniref:N-acetylglucosamine-6-phosphate deacetylase n=1 Tax=Companilactobacillus crustorum TaxID=392416 RepID=UPI000EE3F049|nr:N-acetylglucosamine-6-phosphate deacetylase [Companilactobacillus crustorum]WDT65251.1 N-acetylglucosamine-6-phosphate deacetylase [Companilactobacillus crustorum]HCD07538.1 N-acetylglucosamine-6-phosphate deacetylase [Lactobacillus sp.]